IRADLVTGVQTCALPISPAPLRRSHLAPAAPFRAPPPPFALLSLASPKPACALQPSSSPPLQRAESIVLLPFENRHWPASSRKRSEERRVGKEYSRHDGT